MKKLNKKKLIALIKGASLFATGGGVPVSDQLNTVSRVKTDIVLASFFDLPKSSYVATAAEIGPSNAPQIEKKKVIGRMLKLLEVNTGKKISGIYPPEIGQESVVVESASLLNLPILDFDPTGFRAVPYMDINVFNLKNIPYSFVPLAVSNDKEDIFIIHGDFSYKRTEQVLREMTSFSKYKILFILGGLISVNQLIKGGFSFGSYSRSIQYGLLKNFDAIIKKLTPKILTDVTVVKKIEKEKKGFLFEIVNIAGNSTDYKLIILNEAIFLLDSNGKIISSVPERILLLDKKNCVGIPSGDIKVGKKITIAVIDPEKEWKYNHGLFDKNRFRKLL